MFKNKGNNFSLLSFDDENQSKQPNVKNSSIPNSSTSAHFKVPPLPTIKSGVQRAEKIKELQETITAIRSLEDALKIQPYIISKDKIETQLELAKKRLTELGNIQLEELEKDLIAEHPEITTKQPTEIDYENDVLREDKFLIKIKKCISDLDKIYYFFNKINNITCEINAKKYPSSVYDLYSYNDDFLFIIKINEFQKSIESHKKDYVNHIKSNNIAKNEISTKAINSQFAKYDELKAEIKSSFIKQITYINESLAELQESMAFNNVLIDKTFVSLNNHLYLSTLIKTLESISPKNIIDNLVINESTYYHSAYSVQVLFKEYYDENRKKMHIIESNMHTSLATFEKDTRNYSSKLKRDRKTFENDDKTVTNRLPHNNKNIGELMQDITIIKSFKNRLELIPEMKRWFNVIENDLNLMVYIIERNNEITNDTIDMYRKIASSLDNKIHTYLTKAKEAIDNSLAKDLVLAQDLGIKIGLIKFDGSTIKNLENYISIMEKYINWKSVNHEELINNDFSNMEKSFSFKPSTSGIFFSNNNLPLSSNKRKGQPFTYKNEILSLKEESSSAPNEVVHQHTNKKKYF